jgi:hypothetical protein
MFGLLSPAADDHFVVELMAGPGAEDRPTQIFMTATRYRAGTTSPFVSKISIIPSMN